MCYSPESSFGTFFFVLVICIYLWIKGSKIQKTLAIILLFISLMQVVEGLLWLNVECTDTNKNISRFIPILLYLQPIVAIGAVYFFGTGFLSPIMYKSLIAIWLLCLPLFLDWMKDGLGQCTIVGPKGHLAWPYANESQDKHSLIQNIYNIILSLAFITLNTQWYGFLYVGVAALGYSASRNLYGHSWGSIWCHFVNLLAIGAIFV
jgi:hypothetical protein